MKTIRINFSTIEQEQPRAEKSRLWRLLAAWIGAPPKDASFMPTASQKSEEVINRKTIDDLQVFLQETCVGFWVMLRSLALRECVYIDF